MTNSAIPKHERSTTPEARMAWADNRGIDRLRTIRASVFVFPSCLSISCFVPDIHARRIAHGHFAVSTDPSSEERT